MDNEPIFVDTWGWMALGHSKKHHHADVRRIYQELRKNQIPIYTSDYVLDELITLLFRRETYDEAVHFLEGIQSSAALGQLQVERVTSDRFFTAWELRKRFQDKPTISFTDLTSMAIMDERGILKVLTEDEHFIQVGMGFSIVP